MDSAEIRALEMIYRLRNNMLWNSIGSLFYFGCQWLLTIFVVYFEGGYSDAGILSLAMSFANVLAIVASLNLRTFQVSELEGQFSDGDFLRSRVLTSGVALVFCICVVIYKGYSRHEGLCIFTFMIFKVSEVLGDVLHGIDQKAWRLDIAGKSFILRGFAILIAMACGMLLGGSLIITIILMAVLAYIVIFFYDYRQCKKQCCPDTRSSQNNVLALVKIGIPLALCSLLLNLISIYPRFQIEEQLGKELLGVFASIATPTVLVTQLASFIFTPLMGMFAEHRKKRDAKRIYQLLLVSLGATAVIGAAAVAVGKVLGEWALVLLFGGSIRAYAYLLVPIIYSAVLTALNSLLSGLLTVFKDYYAMTALTAASLILCVIFAPLLIAEKYLMGAVFALLLALSLETLLLMVRLIFLLKREKLLYRRNAQEGI